MTYTTAIITPQTITARCEVDDDGCLIWQGSAIQGKPYWSTYDENGKRVNVNVAREMAESVGHIIKKGHKIKRTCGKFLCVKTDCMYLPSPPKMFSQLVKESARPSFW